MKDNNTAFDLDGVFWSILYFLNILLCIVTLFIVIFFKKKKSREDLLIIEKKVVDIAFILFILLYILIDVFRVDDKDAQLPEQTVISLYIIVEFTLKMAILYEDYKNKHDPTYLMRQLLKGKYKYSYFYEIAIAFFIGIYFTSKIIDHFNTDEVSKKYLFCDSIACVFILSVLSVANIVILAKQRKVLKFSKDKRNYTEKRFLLDSINFCLTLVFALSSILLEVYAKIVQHLENKEYYVNSLEVYTWFYIFYSFADSFILFFKFYFTDFYYYTLSNTWIKGFYRCFGDNYYRRPLIFNSDIYENALNNNNSSIYFHDKLNMPIDEVILSNFDFLLNCMSSSLNLVYEKSIIQQADEGSNIMISDEKNLTSNKLLKSNNQKLNQSLINKQASEVYYRFQRKHFVGDKFNKMFADKDIEGFDLDILVTSYYQKSFEKLTKEKKVNLNHLKTSLVSHVLENGQRISLLDKNCRDMQFSKLKSLVIKTLDKQYAFEFVTNDFFKNVEFFKKYIKYIRKVKNTFIPIILGIYKLRVNDLQEINFILFKNNFVEELPKDIFNYWQILRVNSDTAVELLNSSNEINSLIIDEEPILSDNRILSLFEYHAFCEILTLDLNFMREMQIIDFNLIFLYYEIGANPPNTNFSIDDERSPGVLPTPNKEKELLAAAETKEREKYANNSILNRISSVMVRTTNQVGNDFSLENSIKIDLSNLQDNRGFEAVNNNHKSLIFFNFENVFQNHSLFEKEEMYKGFKDFIVKFFEEIFT